MEGLGEVVDHDHPAPRAGIPEPDVRAGDVGPPLGEARQDRLDRDREQVVVGQADGGRRRRGVVQVHLLGVPGREPHGGHVAGADRPGRDPEGHGRVDPAREADDEASAACGLGHLAHARGLGLEDRLERFLAAEERDPVERTARGAHLVKSPTAVAGRDVDCDHRIGQHGRVESLPDSVERRGPDAIVRRNPGHEHALYASSAQVCGEIVAFEARIALVVGPNADVLDAVDR